MSDRKADEAFRCVEAIIESGITIGTAYTIAAGKLGMDRADLVEAYLSRRNAAFLEWLRRNLTPQGFDKVHRILTGKNAPATPAVQPSSNPGADDPASA